MLCAYIYMSGLLAPSTNGCQQAHLYVSITPQPYTLHLHPEPKPTPDGLPQAHQYVDKGVQQLEKAKESQKNARSPPAPFFPFSLFRTLCSAPNPLFSSLIFSFFPPTPPLPLLSLYAHNTI